MRPSVARGLALLMLGAMSAPGRPPTPNHGSVTCDQCKRMAPASDPLGSFTCICGNALYVDPSPLPAPEPSP